MHMSFRTESPNTSVTQHNCKKNYLYLHKAFLNQFLSYSGLQPPRWTAYVGWYHLEDHLALSLAKMIAKTMEKAAVLDSDEVCRVQLRSVGFRLHDQHLNGFGEPGVCSSSWRHDGVCRRTESHRAEDCDGRSGEVFSLCKCLFSQQSKPVEQTSDGFRPKYMPVFLPACVCVCLCFFCLLYVRTPHPFMKTWCKQKNKPESHQAVNDAETKVSPAAQKYQETPTPLPPTTSMGRLGGSTMLWLLASTNTQLPGRENS